MTTYLNIPNKILMDSGLNNKTKNILMLFYSMKNNQREVRLTLPEIVEYTDVNWVQHASSFLKKGQKYYSIKKEKTSSGKRNVYILAGIEKDSNGRIKDYTGIPIELYKKYRKKSDIIVNYAKFKFVNFLVTDGGKRKARFEDYIIVGQWKEAEFLDILQMLQQENLIHETFKIKLLEENTYNESDCSELQLIEQQQVPETYDRDAEKVVIKFYEMLTMLPSGSQRKKDVKTVLMALRNNPHNVQKVEETLNYMINIRKYQNMNQFIKSMIEVEYYNQLESLVGQAIKRYYEKVKSGLEFNMLKSNFEHAEHVMRSYNLTQTQFDFVVDFMIDNKVEVFNYIDGTVNAALKEWRNKKGNVSFNNSNHENIEKKIELAKRMMEIAKSKKDDLAIQVFQNQIEELSKKTNAEVN